MTRITSGRYGGRRLVTPSGDATRPTSEKVRAALGNTLAAGGGLSGAAVLDLYAGSGALGLELLSRGAATLVLVERDRSALTAARRNVDGLAAHQLVRIVAADVGGYVTAPAAGAAHFDIVLADPPYDRPAETLAGELAALVSSEALAPAADVVIERSARDGPFPWPPGFAETRVKRYGDTVLCYGRAP